jgi:hypothetical protein
MGLALAGQIFESSEWREPTQRLVLLEAAYRADKKGIIRATQSEIANQTGLSRRTVGRWFQVLEELAVLTRLTYGRFKFSDQSSEVIDELLKPPVDEGPAPTIMPDEVPIIREDGSPGVMKKNSYNAYVRMGIIQGEEIP